MFTAIQVQRSRSPSIGLISEYPHIMPIGVHNFMVMNPKVFSSIHEHCDLIVWQENSGTNCGICAPSSYLHLTS